MPESADFELDASIREGLSDMPPPDFDAWLAKNEESVAYLNPVVTRTYQRRRRMWLRLGSAATAAAIILCASLWSITPGKNAFADTVEVIKKAKTVRWTIAWYDRLQSVDGERTWLRQGRRWERSYLEPNRWRDVRYADDGTISHVTLEDTATGQVLDLNMEKRTAMLSDKPSGQFGRRSPFGSITKILESEPIEFVGTQDLEGTKANVFRHFRETNDRRGESTEIWLDAKSKRLLKYTTTPGKVYFDPQTAPDHQNKPEERFSKGTIAGVINKDIEFDAQLDPSLFSMEPPSGFTIIERRKPILVNEEQMIEWLRLSAAANGGIFLELERGFNMDWHNSIAKKDQSERTDAEQQYLKAARQHFMDSDTWAPMMAFADSFTEARTLRYLGKGIEMGNKDRIVCYYKLKSTKAYRAVYGDLSVKDIDPSELPLPTK